VADLQSLGTAELDLKVIPPRRLTGLATYGLSSKAAALRRLPRQHRLAVLAATVVVLAARATDDVLETFDMVMTTKLLMSRRAGQASSRASPNCCTARSC